MIQETEISIRLAIQSHQQRGIQCREDFEREIMGFPNEIAVWVNSVSEVKKQNLVEKVDIRYSLLREYDLVECVNNALVWTFQQLVYQLPEGGRISVEPVVEFFSKLVLSENFYELALEWLSFAQESGDVSVCVAYCEIVDAGFTLRAIWEESSIGVRRRGRATKLFSLLCSLQVYLEKRRMLASFFRSHPSIAQEFKGYLEIPSTFNHFDQVQQWVERAEEPLPLHYDEAERDQTVRELDAAVEILRRDRGAK